MSSGVPDALVYSQLFFYDFGHVLASMAHGVFGTGSCFRVEWRTAGGSWVSVFRGVSAGAGRGFHFRGGPGRWAVIPWGLGNFLIFPNFLGSLDLGCSATREATCTYCVYK